MKRRVRKIVNFFAFNLLFFALYLNFVHKDSATLPVTVNPTQVEPAAFGGTVPADNGAKFVDKKPSTGATAPANGNSDEVAALKLSIN